MSANVSDRSDPGENDLNNEHCFETFFNVTVNCTKVKSGMAIYGKPIAVALSFLSLLSNLLVVLVIRRMMRKQRSQAQIHLLCLAFSDLGVGIAFAWGAISCWTCNPCESCNEAAAKGTISWCLLNRIIHRCFYELFYNINRFVTLYITYVRAKVVTNFKYAMESQNKTARKCILEVTIFCALSVIIHELMLIFVYVRILPSSLDLAAVLILDVDLPSSFDTLAFAITTGWTVIIASLSLFIILKLRGQLKVAGVIPNGTVSNVTDDFQKLVVTVALAFCSIHIIDVVIHGIFAFNPPVAGIDRRNHLRAWTMYNDILNSSVNLFIYVAVSNSFRNAFVQFCSYLFRLTKGAAETFCRKSFLEASSVSNELSFADGGTASEEGREMERASGSSPPQCSPKCVGNKSNY